MKNRRLGWIIAGLCGWAGVFLLASCRSDPECFFDDECGARSSCVDNACVRDVLLFDGGFQELTWYDDVEPLVRQQCQSCHSDPPVNDAPFPLVTYAHTQAASPFSDDRVDERMAARVFAETLPENYPALTDMEIFLIRRWVQTGSTEGMRDITSGSTTDGGVLGSDGGVPVGPLDGASSAVLVQGGFGQVGDMVWGVGEDALLFTDVPNGIIYSLIPPDALVSLVGGSRQTRGLAVGPNGVLVATEYLSGRVVSDPLSGAPEPVIEDFEGEAFNGPHDVVAREADGQLYFTDPSFGLGEREQELPFNALFRLDPRQFISTEWRGTTLSAPNGLAFSNDQSLMYMTESADGLVLVFDVNAIDGSLGDPTIFLVVGNQPTGVAVDTDDNLYIATALGVQVYSRVGEYLGLIPTPRPASNVVFGGPANDRLFIAVGGDLYAARVNAVGAVP